MSTGLIAGGSLAGIIIALLVVFENLGNALDFSKTIDDLASRYGLVGGEGRAIGAFGVMAVALLVVALLARRPSEADMAKSQPSDFEPD